ncbi:MAG: FkbM family methyltransferase [Actinobacteria bacterium]|nr:FkbM family methyltransferase [Actinomycetota bacterium]
MPSDKPSLVSRVRWKLANLLWPERLRPNKLLTRWRLRASEAEAVARWRVAAGDRARPEARSQNGEDALLWDLVGDREEGFFIEAGAYDGYEFSVSYLFECAGWAGLLVEPLADRAAQAADRRKGSRVVTAALSRPGAPATATFTRDEIEWYSKLGEGEHGSVVRVTTLDALLDGHTGGIDFVVLDLEGHELAALEGFDLERWRPSALLVENNDAAVAVRRYVGERGYDHVLTFAHNDLYVRRDEAELVQRLGSNWEDVGPV